MLCIGAQTAASIVGIIIISIGISQGMGKFNATAVLYCIFWMENVQGNNDSKTKKQKKITKILQSHNRQKIEKYFYGRNVDTEVDFGVPRNEI